MPIKPPNLDDRSYDDILREARALIPQYCPDWTNLGDADPGMTLVQLFAWMSEMILYRLNRVPDKTYVHFLNFIGEERREAMPARVPLTFDLRGDARDVVELPPHSRASTRQGDGGADPLHFLTTDKLTVHDANIVRMVAVKAASKPMARELPFVPHPECPKALLFGGGAGIQLFKMDPIADGPRAYTPYHYLYIAHDDLQRMAVDEDSERPVGKLRIRSAKEGLPVGALFKWQYFTGDPEGPWKDVPVTEEEEQVLGLPELTLKAHLPGLTELDHFGHPDDFAELPKPVEKERFWLRGVVDYEKWLAHRMQDDLEIFWADDRGGEERAINNWEVRSTGRYVEFFVQDLPPIRSGWAIRFQLVDRSLPAGRRAYLPRYKWYYRRGEQWEEVPADRVRTQNTSVVLTGPMADMANDGFNLRAERVETVHTRGFIPDLNVDLTWLRPVEVFLGSGPESSAAALTPTYELPFEPFQPAPTLPALIGTKWFVGSDVLENRAGKPVLIEIEFGFELDGELIEEPAEDYHMQLTYRAADAWRVVHHKQDIYGECTFASLDTDPDGAYRAAKRKIRIELDPGTQLRGLHRAEVGGVESTWLRFELTRANLSTKPKQDGEAPQPISLRVYNVHVGLKGQMGMEFYEEPMPGPRVSTVEFRDENRRLTRIVTRSAGKLSEDFPFDPFIDLVDEVGPTPDGEDAPETEHHALYLQFDKPLPKGNRHAMLFKVRGESYLPETVDVDWQILADAGRGQTQWVRLASASDRSRSPDFKINRTGVLDYSLVENHEPPEAGTWVRALLRGKSTDGVPALPPLTHLMVNTVEAVNLHAFRMEKFSGLGIPNQTIQLRRFPLFLHKDDLEDDQRLLQPDRFADIKVWVTEDDGSRREWRRAPGNTLLTATKDDRVFTVDPVEGVLSFGNGIRGRMLPVGSYNVAVEVYHIVPGQAGNVGAGAITSPEGYADVVEVRNLLPASGGRNAESIDEIIRRAPSVLTSRDRAVTRLDFEIIAKEASAEVARAACDGELSTDGAIQIVVLPHRRDAERVPDPFLAAGLKGHVQRYLARRCLVNVQPQVRLATFQEVDVSVALRLRRNANVLTVRDQAAAWVKNFLDPYAGGIDKDGWPFGGTLFAQDFGRMVGELGEVRHVVDVTLYAVDADGPDAEVPGWEKGQGGKTLVLEGHDLFVLRHVRVLTEEVDA